MVIMTYKKYILSIFLVISCFVCRAFHYDSAAHILQQGKWQEAYDKLVPLIIDNADQADLLYDAGVAAYNLQKYTQTITYFARAAENTQDIHLKIRAYFNAANAAVELKELRKAIEYYDAVLAIDSNNEYAKHNKERVLEMLKEQEQQEQQKQ